MNKKSLRLFTVLFSFAVTAPTIMAQDMDACMQEIDLNSDSDEQDNDTTEQFVDKIFNHLNSKWILEIQHAEISLEHDSEMPENIKNILLEIKRIATARSKYGSMIHSLMGATGYTPEKLNVIADLLSEANAFQQRIMKFNFWITLFCDDGLKQVRQEEFKQFLTTKLEAQGLDKSDVVDISIMLRWLNGELYETDFLSTENIN